MSKKINKVRVWKCVNWLLKRQRKYINQENYALDKKYELVPAMLNNMEMKADKFCF